jgi:hypothetical protein
MFLAPSLTRGANNYVAAQPEDRNPVFRRNFPGEVTVAGAILRYSTTTPQAAR